MSLSVGSTTNPSPPATPVKKSGVGPALTTPPSTPQKNFPLFASPGGRIHVEMSPASKENMRHRAGVYRFKKQETEERYVGASQSLLDRLTSHISTFRHPASDLSRAISEDPSTFTFGVIHYVPPEGDLDKAERTAIQKTDAIHKGFNRRNGGGGGTSHPAETVTKAAFKAALKKFTEQFTSPTQYPFSSLKGRVHLALPESVKKKAGVIYDIIENTEDGPVHYPGYTTCRVGKRMGEHISLANNPRRGHLRGGFYKVLAASPSSFSVAVYKTRDLGVPIQVAERVVIKYFRQQGVAVRNQNGGGGGGRSKH